MLTKQKVLVIITAVFMTTPAIAKIYKWKDANGVTQYTATPPPQAASKDSNAVKEVKIRKKPKSSLTHIPKELVSINTTSKTNKAEKRKLKKRVLDKKTRAKFLKECREASDSKKQKALKKWEREGKSAVADGKETKAGLKRTMKQIRKFIASCNL